MEPRLTYAGVLSATRLKVRLIAQLQSTPMSIWPQHVREFFEQLAKTALDDRGALLAILAGAVEEVWMLTNADRPRTGPGMIREAMPLPLSELLSRAEAELVALTSNSARAEPSPRVRRVAGLIEERYGHRLTVGELARAVSRDRGHVSSVFRREMGHTVHGYLTHVRMRHAADLVRRGEKIEAVMLMVGYHSKKSFYRQFRSHFGVTPGAFRLCGCTDQRGQ